MTHFAQKVPTAPSRTHELHDQSKMPASPHKTRADRARLATLVILGVVLAVVFTAIGIQIRAGWESHRDWVVPVVAVFAAIGGVAASYLLLRGRAREFGIGFILMLIALAIVGANYLRGTETEGPDALRDWFSVVSAIFFGAALISFIVGWLYVEFTSPTKPKQPEM